MMRRLSIRARITLGSLAIAVLLLTAALLVVRAQVASILSAADSALARGDLVAFATDIAADPTAEVDDPGTGILVYVRDPAGTVEVDTLPHDILEVIESRSATDEEFPFTDDEERDFIVVGRSVATDEGDWALWSARSTSSSELALDGLDRVLLIGGLVLLAGFGAASWFVTTTALRPVSRMRRQADALGATLDGELPVGETRDEITALALTLNELLGRVRGASLRERQMISDAAHELRTPLATLTTQLELAHRDEADAAALARHLRGVEVSVARLSSLAANLLELNRMESGPARTAESDGAELTDELMKAVDRARILGGSRSVEIAFDARSEAGDRRYRIDPQAFGRVLDNLIANSLAAVPKGGHIDVALSESGDGLVLIVTDDGHGMPESFIPHAFERFSRPDAARSAAQGGSGLGLALVRAIAEAAGGTVELTNRRPGLEVRVHLPKM